MKKICVTIFVFLFVFSNAFAQKKNDKGSTGGNNNNTKPQNTDKNTDGGSTNGLLLQFTKIVFGAYQQVLISKRGSDPAIFGFEAGINGGFLSGNSDSYIAVDPRIRYNKGALSFDVRYDYLKGNVTFQNFDALAEFNIIVGNAFKAAIGQGIMYNIENSLAYHESYFGMDIGFNDKQILISPEFRLAYDWSVKKPVNTELALKGSYRLLNVSVVSVYINAGAGYRYMANNGTFGNVFGGLNLIF